MTIKTQDAEDLRDAIAKYWTFRQSHPEYSKVDPDEFFKPEWFEPHTGLLWRLSRQETPDNPAPCPAWEKAARLDELEAQLRRIIESMK